MHIHILGICGTFMGGIALLAKQAGHRVTGSDQAVYPPMSELLRSEGITIEEGYSSRHLHPKPDCVIIGNVLSRGNVAVEYILAEKIPYYSAPAWLAEYILPHQHVIAVAGTHGKTTTSSLIAWILTDAGLAPSFLVGGIPLNFGVSARRQDSAYMVLEADEYDTAFFDKRPKFLHFYPQTLILNALEFDHADIYPNLEAIQRQFGYLLRTVPGNGKIIYRANDINLEAVFKQGCWTPKESFAGKEGQWQAKAIMPAYNEFEVYYQTQPVGKVQWNLLGYHNMENGLAAMAAAVHVGVAPEQAVESLSRFKGVKRRLEVKGKIRNITVYDDFAHHPTAIETTIAGLRAHVGQARILAVIECSSNSMRLGAHGEQMISSLKKADLAYVLLPPDALASKEIFLKAPSQVTAYSDTSLLLQSLIRHVKTGDHILFMSNRSFSNLQDQLLSLL